MTTGNPETCRDPRRIPAVHRLLDTEAGRRIAARFGHGRAAAALSTAAGDLRRRMLSGTPVPLSLLDPEALAGRAEVDLEGMIAPVPRRVINATGVVLHTNLGRAVLAEPVLTAVTQAAGSYSDLEYDLEAGERGSRHDHLEPLLRVLTGAEAAMVVNNNAAAVLLALSALAGGRGVVVSRGELVEIGGAFRVPEVMAQGGARLVEVGTTNRTRPADYRAAIRDDTALLLKVHTSNYRIVGFTEDVGIEALAEVGREHGLPVMYDLGSGLLLAPETLGLPAGLAEPSVTGALKAGADLVTFSGDKLLGGPQAGILVGRGDLIDRCRRHPLARALRVGKMTIAALAATLALYLDPAGAVSRVPALRMLTTGPEELAGRAAALAGRLAPRLAGAAEVSVVDEASPAGGGSLPGVELPARVVRIVPVPGGAGVAVWERALRRGWPPVVARVREDSLLLDLRAVPGEEEEELVEAVAQAVREA